jgi:predicted metal-dependent HD superfamily phosphohydrolase
MLEIFPDHLAGDPHLGDRVAPREIAELRMNRWPPEVVLRDGRIGFVSPRRRRDLEHFGRLHGIPFVERDDLWSLLCEEFLDTEFDETHRHATMRVLAENGMPEDEVDAIRNFIRWEMLARTVATWEWVHYGLLDLLRARPIRIRPPIENEPFLPRDNSNAELHRWGEAIANRAAVKRSDATPLQRSDEAVRRRLSFVSSSRPVNAPGWRERRDQLEALAGELLTAWSSRERHYHTPRHLLAVLEAVEHEKPADAFKLAAWFHDAIYDPTRRDNEERSAEWLERSTAAFVADGDLDAADVQLALRMIRATARPLEPIDDEALAAFLDADFQIFASVPEDYDRYALDVRREYAFLSDDSFRAGRRTFLEALQTAVDARGFFFRSASPLAESLARQNLSRELGQLR